jgi:DNA primase
MSSATSFDSGRRWEIADVLVRVDLAALLDEHTTAIGYGRTRRWHCPVPEHSDTHASVTVHTDSRGHERWRCWSGDDTHRGDAIDLLVATQRLSRADAIAHLAERVGLDHETPAPRLLPRPPARRVAPSDGAAAPVALSPLVERYVRACERILASNAGRPVRAWLAERGLDPDIAAANRIGADPGRQRMPRRGGLPFGHGIAATFPAFDEHGRLAYVQTRYLVPRPGSPKYENPARHLGTNPRLSWTIPLRSGVPECLVVCEGIPDALLAARAGLHTVAVLGAQASGPDVALRLATYANTLGLEVVAVIDADGPGRAAGERLARLLRDHGVTLRIVEPPGHGWDLTDWARRDPNWALHPDLQSRDVARGLQPRTLGLP